MAELEFLPELDSIPPAPRRSLSIAAMVLLLGVALAVLVIGIALVRQQQGQPTQGPAPDFTITTFHGEEFTLSEHLGKVVVINFWASWCQPCREEAPALERLWQRYKDEDVVFLGVTFSDVPSDSLAFMEQYGMTYPVAEDGRGEISKGLYRIQGVPETFVIDRDGNIERFFYFLSDDEPTAAAGSATPPPNDPTRPVTTEELARIIDRLLAES